MILKCPYCYEKLTDSKIVKCPHCEQFFLDPIQHSDHPSLDKKNCTFCDKKVLREAKICQYCHRWLDEVDRLARDVDLNDLV